MTGAAFSRERVDDVLTSTKLPESVRIFPRRHLKTPLGVTSGDSRFCAKADGFTLLYASGDFATAFVETIVRDRFMREDRREVLLKEVTERAWALIATSSRAKLNLLDLRKDGCVRLGAPTDTVRARNHAAGRKFGRAIHSGHEDIDGLLFSSRLTGGDVCAIFDRAIAKLKATRTGMLPDHPDLARMLSTYDIKLIAT
ncbi:MAG: RES family NAD+ phosphorylase [Hyphomicrobiaceae bacterium]|nr:RES family NAD+ phosphorylase [Hyphomicrobiaceae bacterium]